MTREFLWQVWPRKFSKICHTKLISNLMHFHGRIVHFSFLQKQAFESESVKITNWRSYYKIHKLHNYVIITMIPATAIHISQKLINICYWTIVMFRRVINLFVIELNFYLFCNYLLISIRLWKNYWVWFKLNKLFIFYMRGNLIIRLCIAITYSARKNNIYKRTRIDLKL